MSDLTHYQQLGVTEDASFDEIQAARERLRKQHSDDEKLLQKIEAAYDAILLDRLRLRQEGKIKVPDRIRFPERTIQPAPPPASESSNQMPGWLERLIDTPSKADILWPAGIYLTLSGISIYGATTNPKEQLATTVLQFTLALGVGSCIYFLNRKENKFGRAILLTVITFITGLTLGAILSPVGAATGLNTEIFISLLTFLILWLVSSFLR